MALGRPVEVAALVLVTLTLGVGVTWAISDRVYQNTLAWKDRDLAQCRNELADATEVQVDAALPAAREEFQPGEGAPPGEEVDAAYEIVGTVSQTASLPEGVDVVVERIFRDGDVLNAEIAVVRNGKRESVTLEQGETATVSRVRISLMQLEPNRAKLLVSP